MVVAFTSEQWTVLGVLLTAVFTGGTLVTAWLAYRHGLRLAGDRRPIRIRKRIPGLGWHEVEDAFWTGVEEKYPIDRVRVATVHLFNASGEKQVVRFRGLQSKIIWPRSARGGHLVPMEEVEFESRSGGNVAFLHVNHQDWSGKDMELKPPGSFRFKRRYWLRLRGVTRSGLKVRYFGPVTLDAFPGSEVWRTSLASKDPDPDA